MLNNLRNRLAALEGSVAIHGLRLPTFAEFYAGRSRDGDVLPNGEVIKLPPGAVPWDEFYGIQRCPA